VPELDRLVRRLRGLSPSAWRSARRVEAVRELAEALAAIGGEGHQLPDVPEHSWPEVIAVLGADAHAVDPVAAERLAAAAWDRLS
jgi:hypothetical protein